ncbi:hypothetical protein BS47DRAFT_1352288, partial [Hydnum rufescens UP504]
MILRVGGTLNLTRTDPPVNCTGGNYCEWTTPSSITKFLGVIVVVTSSDVGGKLNQVGYHGILGRSDLGQMMLVHDWRPADEPTYVPGVFATSWHQLDCSDMIYGGGDLESLLLYEQWPVGFGATLVPESNYRKFDID